jgi:uncharacterized protein
MPVRTSYLQGTPNWVDLQTPDQDAAKAFYGPLFGWTFDDQPIPDNPVVYSMALKGDRIVAAIAPQQPEQTAQGAPATWNTYLAVDHVDAAAARVDAAGGKILMPPFDVMDAGRMALVLDPTGAPVAMWQAGRRIGSTLVNEPGTVIWNDLRTDDPAAAAAFYSAVFGLNAESQEWGDTAYVSLKTGDDAVCGISQRAADSDVSAWHVYFAVDDTARVAENARSLGATIVVEPTDSPIGPTATIADPQGAVLSIISIAAS